MSPVSRAGPVCQDDFQPGFSTNDSSTNYLDHLVPVIWWLIFCTYAAGKVTFTSTSYLDGGTWISVAGYRARKRNLILAR